MASRVGKYLLFETLGEGAFGKVKLGVHEESGEQVAVKIMDKSDIKAQEMTMNVRREIAIMKALKHRNIVNLRQVLTSQSKLYIVMDLVTGGELFTKILNEGKLEEIIARRYFQQLVDGIEYCHRRGVCHRDLKPENLLIDETTGELKITDFGLSAMKGASTTEELLHTQCGSPNYCAPEIIARHKQGYNGNKVDAWSCGIILFALLAGFLPFYDENTKVLYRMIQRDDVKFPRKFPPDAKDLVLRLLHKVPEKRYTLVEVKKHPWFAIDYDGDDAVPKSTASGASPPARRRRRGHSRKSSVDQAPRSRELREIVPRKKSGKSDNDSGGTVPMPPIPPGGQPVPPPIVIDSGPRSVPPAHRPPAPPSISPPPPRSPLPPLPPPPPTTNSIAVQQSIPQTQGPLPPPPPPTVPPPPVSPYGNATTSRPVPPYAVVGVVRRKSRESRDAHPNNVGSVTSGESSNVASVANSGITSNAVPSYSSLSEGASQIPTPPTFPAPGGDGDRLNVHVYSPPPVRKSSGSASVSMPNGAPPPPPATVPPTNRSLDTNATTGPSVVPGVSPTSAPAAVSFSPAPTHVERQMGVTGPAFASSAVPEAPTVSPTAPSASRSDVSLREHLTPAEEKKAPSSPSRNVRKWTVTGPTPPPSYRSTTMAPVMTPSALASGDASWLKRTAAGNEIKVDTGRTVKFDVMQQEEKETEAPRVEASSEPEPMSRPLSIVERQRMLYNKLATESEMPPPLPDTTLRSSSYKSEPTSSMKVEPKSAPRQRFSDRVEVPKLSGYPTGHAGTTAEQVPAMSPPGIGNLSSRDGASDVSELPSASYSKSDRTSNAANETGWTAVPASVSVDLPKETDEVINAETKVEHVGDTTDRLPVGGGVTVLADDDEGPAPLKQRLTAALARYRRIFKLGNNIGITASPSFNSNRGSGISVGSGDDGTKSQSSSRAEFFARAKTITGAWGIILTQELDDDSDSDDDMQQVTEAELQAFSRLLDFWDNRRASATIPKGGEVVLDDESSSPLSEEDIASIQSLLQKLEPKQVEEEMTEVAEEAGDLSIAQGITAEAPTHGENVDSLEDLDVEDINILPTGTARRSPEHSAPSEISLGVHSHSGELENARRSGQTAHTGLTKPAPVSPPPPPPPPMAPVDGIGRPRTVPVPPPPPMPRKPKVETVASWDRGAPGTNVSVSAPPPPPPPPPRPVSNSQRGAMPPPPPPPPYAAPTVSATAVENQQQRMVVTQSTVRDPFRPRPPPSYPPPQSPGNGSLTFLDDAGETDPRVVLETTAAVRRGARIPQSLSHDADLSLAIKRKSSTTTSEFDIEARKTVSRDSGRAPSAASAASEGSGAGKGRHFRSPSRDEHATRGMFAFGMFSRRKSSPLTSFDSELAPDRCLLEIGRILTAMGCSVLMKRGESKMKCEAPLRQEKLLISITCTREKKVTTIHFKKGRKDRSQVDAKEFYEFFQKVHTRFHERVGSGVHVQN